LEKPIRVKIFDCEYLIKGEEDEEQVKRIVQYVNDKFLLIKDNSAGLSEKKVAILAAFDIASDYFRLLGEREKIYRDIQSRARVLNYQIDSIAK